MKLTSSPLKAVEAIVTLVKSEAQFEAQTKSTVVRVGLRAYALKCSRLVTV